jgi:hypothetical protein
LQNFVFFLKWRGFIHCQGQPSKLFYNCIWVIKQRNEGTNQTSGMFFYRLKAQCYIPAFHTENEGQVDGEGKP